MPEYRALCNVVLNSDKGPDYVEQGDTREFDTAPSTHWERVGGEVAPEPTPAPAPELEPAPSRTPRIGKAEK